MFYGLGLRIEGLGRRIWGGSFLIGLDPASGYRDYGSLGFFNYQKGKPYAISIESPSAFCPFLNPKP